MAKGIYNQSGTISANTNTAITQTPGAGERIYILELNISVSVAGTSSRLIVQDGSGGTTIARMVTTAADAILNLYFATGNLNIPGYPLAAVLAPAAGNPVNINTTGTGAATVEYNILYQIR